MKNTLKNLHGIVDLTNTLEIPQQFEACQYVKILGGFYPVEV